MDEDKLKNIVGEVVNKAVEPIIQRLSGVEDRLGGVEDRLGGVEDRLGGVEGELHDPDTGLSAINRRLDVNTAAIVELEAIINGYGDTYKINDSNIRKMQKRLETLEDHAGIDILPELHLSDVA